MKKMATFLGAIVTLLTLSILTGCGGGGANDPLTNNPKDGAALSYIAPGTFTMGTSAGIDIPTNEQPPHRVTLNAYYIYRTEVTVAQYRTFCTATSRALPTFPAGYSWAGKTGWNDPALQNHPIVHVTWDDATAYAAWAGAALPTEAQWEFAARGTGGRNYPWGGTAVSGDASNGWDQTKCANAYNSANVGISTWPVGSFAVGASPEGAHDMAGNVWEWCADWYEDYTVNSQTNPTGPANGTSRVVRGGSWDYNPGNLRGAYRTSALPTVSIRELGFRCVYAAP